MSISVSVSNKGVDDVVRLLNKPTEQNTPTCATQAAAAPGRWQGRRARQQRGPPPAARVFDQRGLRPLRCPHGAAAVAAAAVILLGQHQRRAAVVAGAYVRAREGRCVYGHALSVSPSLGMSIHNPSHQAAAGGSNAPSLSLSLSFLAPTRTDALATAAAARRASTAYGGGDGSSSLLLLGSGGGFSSGRGVGGRRAAGGEGAAAPPDVFLPQPLSSPAFYAPNDGLGASLGPAAVAAQVRAAKERRGRQR